jgi:hypothetical protein
MKGYPFKPLIWRPCSLLLLRLNDVLGYGSSVALFHVKTYFFAFSKSFEAWHGDRGKVNEYVPTVFFFNEAVSLFVVEPLYDPFRQSFDLL